MKRRASFHNLGCKVNSYETEAMMQQLRKAGYEIVPFGEAADVCVVNTCTVTAVAVRKSRQMLHRAREKSPGAVIVAAGCYVQDAEAVLRADPDVDLLIGNEGKSRLAQILDGWFAGREAEAVCRISDVREYEELGMSGSHEHTRAFVKIQDGCNQFCTYCMIPYVRGRVRSRKKEEVLREIALLAGDGFREIVLTGIHLSSYGLDFRGERARLTTPYADEAETNEDLLALIREAAAVPGVSRIRLGSLEPGIMTETFVRELSRIPEICPQFHLSLQSGSDGVLARMKRRYRTADFAEKCALLRQYFSAPAITTDLITGFPGETEEEFTETEAFVRKIRFAKTHIFPYSRRKGTEADRMKDQVPDAVKKSRSARLIALDEENRRAFAASFIGSETEVLFEEPKETGGARFLTGHTREFVPVYAVCAEDLSGQTARCCGTALAEDGALLVRICREEEAHS